MAWVWLAKMTTPRISVITVTRNLIEEGRAESIRAAIDCVQKQGDGAFEHMIWDGASTDGTQDLLQGIVDGIADGAAVPIRYSSQPDQSLYDAMNRASDLADGDYVVFLNSDDLLAGSDCLRKVCDLMGDQRPDFAFGETIYVNEDGSRRHGKLKTVNSVLQRNPFCHNSMLIRRDVFQEVGGHDTTFRIVGDYDLILRMIAQGRVYMTLPVPISEFYYGGVSSDRMKTALEMTRSWAKNLGPIFGADRYSADDMLDWYRTGQFPISACLTLMRQENPQMRAAALHSLKLTLRRKLQPWRTWDYLS